MKFEKIRNWRKGLQWVARLVLGGALLVAGIFKLIDDSALFETVAYITWLPVWFKLLVVDLLPWAEIVLALLLVTWRLDRWVRPPVIALYIVFLVFAIYGTVTGIEGDCGCFGELMNSTFGWPMILRNTLLLLLSFALYLPVSNRSSG
ncbi:MAG: DoxX family protein [Balneolaceae bacterium]